MAGGLEWAGGGRVPVGGGWGRGRAQPQPATPGLQRPGALRAVLSGERAVGRGGRPPGAVRRRGAAAPEGNDGRRRRPPDVGERSDDEPRPHAPHVARHGASAFAPRPPRRRLPAALLDLARPDPPRPRDVRDGPALPRVAPGACVPRRPVPGARLRLRRLLLRGVALPEGPRG